MQNPRTISGNKLGNNVVLNQGDGNHITVHMDSSNTDSLFLRDISATDPVQDKNRILSSKVLLWDSFKWIFGHPEFNKWRHAKENGVFWIKGDPGKGKTMLLCGIIEDLESDSGANLSYFFCQAADYRINTAAAVVGGLIRQMLKTHPTILSRIRENYEDGPKGQLDGPNALVILCNIFETIIKDPDLTDVICVVDALDECMEDSRHLLSLIIKTSNRVKWLISSRNEKDIEKELDQVPQRLILELKQNAEQISMSIDAYIKYHIQEIDALKNDEQLQEKTLNVLKSKAQGTFLWVALVVKELHNAGHWEVENVLEEVPKDLEDLYGLILDRWKKLGERRQEACQVLLSIITTAKRPLYLGELLVFINSHWKDAKTNKTTYDLRDIQDMAKTCGSILSIRENIVYFIHQSAKDYIIKNAAQRIFPIQHQHYKMFEASLDAMSNVLEYDIYGLEDPAIHIDDVPLKDVGSDPLASIRYCCVFWVEHLVSGYSFEGFEHHKYLKDNGRLHYFLMEKFLCWIEALTLIRSFSQTQIALQKLTDLIDCYCGNERNREELSQVNQVHVQRERETQGLRQFTEDANPFVINCKESVARWPLQLYFSAMAFERHNSIIRKTFERNVREKFGPSPTLASNQQKQHSFRLQGSFRVSEEPSNTPLFFSPDSSLIGRFCEVKNAQVLRLWRADSGNLYHNFKIPWNNRIAFLPNSQDFISVSRDGVIKRWNIDKKSCIGRQSLNLDVIVDSKSNIISKGKVIALSPKGDFVASFHPVPHHLLNLVKVWDTNTARCCYYFYRGEEYREMPREPHVKFSFSPNSQLAALSLSYGTEIIDATTGTTIRHFKSSRGWDDDFQDFHFSPNSKFLVIVDPQQQLCFWDTNTWKLIHVIEMSPESPRYLTCLAITPDSAILATSTNDDTQLWNTSTGDCVARFPESSWSMAFAPSWTQSSVMALQQQKQPGVIHIGVVNISQSVSEEQRVDYTFGNVVISPDSRFVASRCRHLGEVYIWSGDDGQLVHVLGDLETMKANGEVTITRRFTSYPPTFSPDSKLLAHHSDIAGNASIQIWCVLTGKLVCLLEWQGNTLASSVSFSSDPKHLIAGTFDHKIYIWRIDSGQLLHKFDFDDQSQIWYPGLFLVAISSESTHIAAAFQDPKSVEARIWHLRTGKRVAIGSTGKSGTNHLMDYASSRDVVCGKESIFFSSDSAILASVTGSSAQIFDVTTGACLQSFILDGNEQMRSVYFDPIKGQILTIRSVFYKTTSWKRWRASARPGYSYDYYPGGPFSGAWILLDGENNCYVPNHFRPPLMRRFNASIELDMSDSLLAAVNELREVVIIKFPSWIEAREQTIETLNGVPTSDGIPGSADSSFLAAGALATKTSGSKMPTRKRSISNKSSVGHRSGSKVKGRRKKEKEQPSNEDWQPRRSGRIEMALRAKEAEKKL